MTRRFQTPVVDLEEGGGASDCLKQACEHVREGYRYIVDIDLAKIFDEVNHD